MIGSRSAPAVVALMGPTAAGKTDAALGIADSAQVDLISVDSAMVYRRMDIGTAKPTVDVLARYPHALVNIRDPADTYSAAQGVDHDDMNVLCMGERVIGIALARSITDAFLAADFSAEPRHRRRLEKVLDIEARHLKSQA